VRQKVREALLIICLFLFLLVVVGGGLHLNPAGALMAALTGTPLILHAFNLWSRRLSGYVCLSRRVVTIEEDDPTTCESGEAIRNQRS
jgi:hypothetical protein